MAKVALRRRLPFWLELAWSETWASKSFTIVFILNLSLGLLGFVTLDTFKGSVREHLEERSRALLGADLVVGAQRAITDAELNAIAQALPLNSRTRRETTTLSMVAYGAASRLVELRAVDDGYPFYGVPRLTSGRTVNAALVAALGTVREAWVEPSLLVQLGVKVGDTLAIGGASFLIADALEFDPAVAAAGLAIAPKVLIGARQLAATGLISKGSRLRESVFVALPVGTDADLVAKAIARAIDPGDLNVRTHREASTDLNRVLLHLNDYLGLVALVALFLAAVGGAYLFRTFLGTRMKDVAILLSLGLEVRICRRAYVAQLTLLGVVASLVTGVLATLLLPLLPGVLGGIVPTGLVPRVGWVSLATALVMGFGASVLVCLPLLNHLAAVRPAALFQEAGGFTFRWRARSIWAWLPAVGLYWVLAVVTAHSIKVGSIFLAIFLVATMLFTGAGSALIYSLGKSRPKWPFVLEQAALNLARHRLASLVSFVAIGLGALLLGLVPQVRALLISELSQAPGEGAPSLFLFDIQPEQLAPIKVRLNELGTALDFVSPMVRARLVSLKGAALPPALPVDRNGPLTTREDERSQRALSRGYNLSYRAALFSSEELVEGQPFTGTFAAAAGKLPEVSVEYRFAERLAVGIGDRLAFEVQGVTVEGIIVNLRRVRWTSFHPNFFVEFQPGVLEDAPQTFIAAVPHVPASERASLQTALVVSFPNVSVIDVTATIDRILAVVGQMAQAVNFMAALTLIAGFAVLFAIAHDQAQRRIPDVSLLKILGTRFATLRVMALVEFGVIGATAGGLGALLSVGGAYVFALSDLDGAWALDARSPGIIWAGVTLVSAVTGLIAISRSLNARSLALLTASR